MKIKLILGMIIGKINENEKSIRFDLELHCTNCEKKVPGGLKASEEFYGSDEFKKELKFLKMNYLCGICRDKKRVQK